MSRGGHYTQIYKSMPRARHEKKSVKEEGKNRRERKSSSQFRRLTPILLPRQAEFKDGRESVTGQASFCTKGAELKIAFTKGIRMRGGCEARDIRAVHVVTLTKSEVHPHRCRRVTWAHKTHPQLCRWTWVADHKQCGGGKRAPSARP